jgi:hypothetical protein
MSYKFMRRNVFAAQDKAKPDKTEAKHSKYTSLKLGGGQAYGRSSDYAAVAA